jgi:hypothetical protein
MITTNENAKNAMLAALKTIKREKPPLCSMPLGLYERMK